MAYAFGQAVSSAELLGAVATFVGTLNSTYWTVLESQVDPLNYTTGDEGSPLVVQHTNGYDPKSSGAADDSYIHLWRSTSSNYGLNLATAFVNDSNVTKWWGQTGARFGQSNDTNAKERYCRTSHGDSSISQYHLFGFDDYVYVVFKTTSTGLWRNFAFGHLEKIDTFNGGGFCCASYCTPNNTYEDSAIGGGYTQFFDSLYTGISNIDDADRKFCSQVRVDDGLLLRYVLGVESTVIFSGLNWERIAGVNDTIGFSGKACFPNTIATEFYYYFEPFEAVKMYNAPSTFGLTSPLIPIYHYIYRGNQQRSLTSKLPNIFWLNIRDLVETSIVDIQGSNYMVFPSSKKTPTTGQDGTNRPNSYYFGFAILKDA